METCTVLCDFTEVITENHGQNVCPFWGLYVKWLSKNTQNSQILISRCSQTNQIIFFFVFILQPFNCTCFKNHWTNFSGVCCKWCVQLIRKCLTYGSFCMITSHVLPNIFIFLNCLKLFVFNVGTPALTSRALGENDFIQVAEFIHQGVQIAAQAKKEAGMWQKWHQMLLVLWSYIIFSLNKNWHHRQLTSLRKKVNYTFTNGWDSLNSSSDYLEVLQFWNEISNFFQTILYWW